MKAPANLKWEIQPDAVLGGSEENHRIMREGILDAQERQTKYAGGNEITFEVGEWVWLSTKHIRMTRPSKNINWYCGGPSMVSKIIDQNT